MSPLLPGDHDDQGIGQIQDGHDPESLPELWKPEIETFLDQMRIAPVCENFSRRDGRYGEKPGVDRHPLQIVQDGIQTVRLDMFQNIKANNEFGGLRRIADFGNRRVVLSDPDRARHKVSQRIPETALATAIV